MAKKTTKPEVKKSKRGTATTPIPKDKLTFGGRPLGAKNKLTSDLRLDIVSVLRARGHDPAAKLVECCIEAEEIYIETKRENLAKGINRGQSTALENLTNATYKLMEFVYPKLKQSELLGKDGGDLFQSFHGMVKSLVDDNGKHK